MDVCWKLKGTELFHININRSHGCCAVTFNATFIKTNQRTKKKTPPQIPKNPKKPNPQKASYLGKNKSIVTGPMFPHLAPDTFFKKLETEIVIGLWEDESW